MNLSFHHDWTKRIDSMADVVIQVLSPIRRLSFKTTNSSRADAFGVAILRSTFRKRHRTAVFRRWFNWTSWKKQGSSFLHLHSDLIPFIITQSEFRVAQVLKSILAWSFILWSNFFAKKRKYSQIQVVIVSVSQLRKLRSSISKLHGTATRRNKFECLLAKISFSNRRRFITKSFRRLQTSWKAAKLRRQHNLRFKRAVYNQLKDSLRAHRAKWTRFYSACLFIKYVRKWRTSIRVRTKIADLHTKVSANAQGYILNRTFFSWLVSHSNRSRAVQMHKKSLSNTSFQHWLLESVVGKNQRLLIIKMQHNFNQKLLRSAINELASWTKTSFGKYDLLVKKQLCQKFKHKKLTIFQRWSFLTFRGKDLTFQNSIEKMIKKSAAKMVRLVVVCWWARMKQTSHFRVKQQRQLLNLKRMVTMFWRMFTGTMATFRSNSTVALIRRGNRRLLVLCLSLWKVVIQHEAQRRQLLQQFDVEFFQLSRIFCGFLSGCKNHKAELRLFSNRSVLRMTFHAWYKQSQKKSTLECAFLLLTKMRIIRHANEAITCLKLNMKMREITRNGSVISSENLPKPKFLSSAGLHPLICYLNQTSLF